jgi:putative endonuclease
MTGYVYIMASQRNGTLYTGVTNDLIHRTWEHREGLLQGFTRKYGCKILVWYEEHYDITDAIQREKNIKQYYRKWKLNLIEAMNPNWDDLYLVICQ